MIEEKVNVPVSTFDLQEIVPDSDVHLLRVWLNTLFTVLAEEGSTKKWSPQQSGDRL
jgi:hypothetical protein